MSFVDGSRWLDCRTSMRREVVEAIVLSVMNVVSRRSFRFLGKSNVWWTSRYVREMWVNTSTLIWEHG